MEAVTGRKHFHRAILSGRPQCVPGRSAVLFTARHPHPDTAAPFQYQRVASEKTLDRVETRSHYTRTQTELASYVTGAAGLSLVE